MTFLYSVLREILGLFVDDGRLALQVLALIAVIVALVKWVGLAPLAGAVLLAAGCLAILALGVARARK